MESFVYYAPTEVIFGRGAEEKTGKAVKKMGRGPESFLSMEEKARKKSGLLGKIQRELEEENIVWEGLGGVKPNPRLSLAEEGGEKSPGYAGGFYPGSRRGQRH